MGVVLKYIFVALICTRVVTGECFRNRNCEDSLEILKSIKAYPDNYQQLLNAFYPINRAKPSSVIIAYFTNYTDPLPEECSLGTYPWKTYPGINYAYHKIDWYMWTTTPIYSIRSEMIYMEFGEYLPAISYDLLFNKSSPFVLPSQIACIKTPWSVDTFQTFGDVTTQVLSVVSQKLQESYEQTSLTGILYMDLIGNDVKENDVRFNHHMGQGYLHDGYGAELGFNGLLVSICLLAPFILYYKGEHAVKRLQQSENKYQVPFFWAVASLAHVFNVYFVGRLFLVTCVPYRNSAYRVEDCEEAGEGLGITLITTGIVACIHSKYIKTLPVPKTFSIFTKCCGRRVYKIITTISLWGIYISVLCLILCAPLQVLLVSVNPHLYGLGILTLWCAMFVCIIITSIPFTIDQIFIKEEEYRITPKQALRQILLLMFIALLVFGFGSLTFSITLVLHLSKYGERTLSVSKSVYFILRYTALPIASWIVQVILSKAKFMFSKKLHGAT